jgi:hypothetical protein
MRRKLIRLVKTPLTYSLLCWYLIPSTALELERTSASVLILSL